MRRTPSISINDFSHSRVLRTSYSSSRKSNQATTFWMPNSTRDLVKQQQPCSGDGGPPGNECLAVRSTAHCVSGKRQEGRQHRQIPCARSEARPSCTTTATEPANLELTCTAIAGAATEPQTESWCRVPLSHETDGCQLNSTAS